MALEVTIMPRAARKSSETGIYHVMLRGINRQAIFLDDSDYIEFLYVLKNVKETSRCKFYAYCLMENHIHFLVKENGENISTIVKRIGSAFATWYNKKYRRVGHLFQNRFKSEPVESESYFYTVIRYIHQNPVKAEICLTPGEYKYSSYGEYFSSKGALDICSCNSVFKKYSYDNFLQFNNACCFDLCLEDYATEEEEFKRISERFNLPDKITFSKLPLCEQEKIIKEMRTCGIPIRKIVFLTGKGMNFVRQY